MEVINLLEYINNTKTLYALNYAKCDTALVNFLDLISVEKEFTQKIDLGLIYISEITMERNTIIDGLSRILSLSLLLHAICECYKKTSERNDKAINTIRRKYLLNGSRTRLRLPKEMQNIYDKIIYGERLSGKEKEHPMFKLLHNFWQEIKERELKAAYIFDMLQKIKVTLVTVNNIPPRDLYYSLNHTKRELNQVLLIEDYLNSISTKDKWEELKGIFLNKYSDIVMFFKDFFCNKFNYDVFNEARLYEYFVNYFETMLKYSDSNKVISKICNSAKLYSQLINVNMQDNDLNKAMIELKMRNCDDTYAYLLSVYEDYSDGSLSKATLLEIFGAIKEYLQNREKTQNNVGFNELIKYLNAFIAYK